MCLNDVLKCPIIRIHPAFPKVRLASASSSSSCGPPVLLFFFPPSFFVGDLWVWIAVKVQANAQRAKDHVWHTAQPTKGALT